MPSIGLFALFWLRLRRGQPCQANNDRRLTATGRAGLLTLDTLTGASHTGIGAPQYPDRHRPYRDRRAHNTLTGASHTGIGAGQDNHLFGNGTIIREVTFMGLFSWLFGPDHTETQAGAPQSSMRPAWAAAFAGSRPPIQFCSPVAAGLIPENALQQQDPEVPAATTAVPPEAVIQPIAGADSAVPWPWPADAQALTFWGAGGARTAYFDVPSDAVLRIVVRSGPIALRVRRRDGSFLEDTARLDGQDMHFGLMAIPVGGVYCLLVEAATGIDWGVTVVYQ
jgi:hypothetical protein